MDKTHANLRHSERSLIELSSPNFYAPVAESMSARPFKYHAALSFAGENRKLAESLFHSLTERGFRVFYDADRQAHLWGKNSKEFLKIYGPQSHCVIPIISKYYVNKPWTQYEFDAALKEQQKRRSEFILPIRVDDTPLLGLSESVIRQDGRKKSSEELAELFAAKCRPSRGVKIPSSLWGPRSSALGLLRSPRPSGYGGLPTAIDELRKPVSEVPLEKTDCGMGFTGGPLQGYDFKVVGA
jgi:hypothetical protein